LGHVARVLDALLQFLERAVGRFQKRRTCGGELDRPFVAQEQAEAQLLFQPADRLAQGRLCHVQAQGGLVKMQLLGDGNELPEQACLDHCMFLSMFLRRGRV